MSEKPVIWLKGEVKNPPFSKAARIEAGALLGRLQQGELLSLPHSRPMPSIGKNCHELRIPDKSKSWRIIYRIDSIAIMVVEVFQKMTQKTPGDVIKKCKKRLATYDAVRASLKRRKGSGNE